MKIRSLLLFLFLIACFIVNISSALDITFISNPPGANTYVYNSGPGWGILPEQKWGVTPFTTTIGGISPGGPCLTTQYDFRYEKNGYQPYSGHFTLTSFDCTIRIEPIRISGTLTPITPILTQTKIGIYNGGNWYIDFNGDGQFTPSTDDRYIPYGATGWTHLVGDWNGDGKSEIGIYKDGVWYIDYGGSGVIDANTRYYSFGGTGWTPLVGDWNADTKDEIGVYNAGNWYLDYDGDGAWSAGDRNYGFGTNGWIPVLGKW